MMIVNRVSNYGTQKVRRNPSASLRSMLFIFFFFSSRRRHTRFDCDWSSDVCSSDLLHPPSAIDQIAGTFGLSTFERQLLLLCAGIEMDSTLAAQCSEALGFGRNEIGRASCRERV